METDGTWTMANYSKTGNPDLVFIKTANCGTNSVEVHVASAASQYKSRILETGTTFAMETDGTWLMYDFDNDGIPDLVFIKTANCGTNTVEVHVASGASNYQKRILETGTTFAMETDGTWLLADFDHDGIPDLVFIKTANCATNSVEVHVASGKSNYQTRILETGTTFAMETDGTWLMADFDGDGIPDLIFIKTANCGTNTVEVHIASSSSGYKTRILETGTTFAMETDGTWIMNDFQGNKTLDLIFLKTANCGTNTVEVHVSPQVPA
jgi:predicted nuclease of predicted toxin-antitoxin system